MMNYLKTLIIKHPNNMKKVEGKNVASLKPCLKKPPKEENPVKEKEYHYPPKLHKKENKINLGHRVKYQHLSSHVPASVNRKKI